MDRSAAANSALVPQDEAGEPAAAPAARPVFGMPRRLVLVRHGESEANRVQRAVKDGSLQQFPADYLNTPDREFRLTESNGQPQADVTGQWLSAEYPHGFQVYCVSDHVRAQETIARACLAGGWPDVRINIDPQLGEKSWGNFADLDPDERQLHFERKKRDPLGTPVPDGETMLAMRLRTRVLLDRCAREYSGKDVLVVTHGEYIEAIWAEIAHMSTEKQLEFFHSPAGDIKNCRVIEFAAEDPASEEWNGRLRWVRSSCAQAKIFGPWTPLERQRFSPEQLLERVGRYGRLNLDGLE